MGSRIGKWVVNISQTPRTDVTLDLSFVECSCYPAYMQLNYLIKDILEPIVLPPILIGAVIVSITVPRIDKVYWPSAIIAYCITPLFLKSKLPILHRWHNNNSDPPPWEIPELPHSPISRIQPQWHPTEHAPIRNHRPQQINEWRHPNEENTKENQPMETSTDLFCKKKKLIIWKGQQIVFLFIYKKSIHPGYVITDRKRKKESKKEKLTQPPLNK